MEINVDIKREFVELAKKDAKSNIYMGREFMDLRQSEVNKAAPDRFALIAKFSHRRVMIALII